MNSKFAIGLSVALATGLSVHAALADDEPPPPSTTTTQSTTTTAPPPAYPYGGGPAYTTGAASTTTTTTVRDDDWSRGRTREPERAHVRPGLGVNVFGAAGTKDTAALGLGGRIEFVLPFGLALGGSYTQNFNSDRTSVRPLLGEIGVAFPVVDHLEVRPMVGLGYAFTNTSSSGDSTNPGANQSATASATVSTSGFDVAPGAKISYVGSGLEVFTMPKYHFISGNNFFGVELGAGARF